MDDSITKPKTNTVTYNNLIEVFKENLKLEEIDYIQNFQRECYARSRFVFDGWSAADVIQLQTKLIAIKKSKLGQTQFWQGCCYNISDLYSYKEKIMNAYQNLQQSKVNVSITTKNTSPILEKSWKAFIEYTSKKFTKRTAEGFMQLEVIENPDSIKVAGKITPLQKTAIENYFNKPVQETTNG